ncbi:MAG: CPBP family intramembrane glutamic endopeptidase [Thermomicrobium sp.]|nr:CPBP family intramembrane glutamic endopeptidase [Thermomicrobium sp.]
MPSTLVARGWLPVAVPSLAILGGLGPMLSALFVGALVGRGVVEQVFRPLLRVRVNPVWCVVVPGFWIAVAVVAALVVASGTVGERLFVWFAWPEFVLGFAGSLVSNVWEEIGWRGFALPRLAERWGDLVASVWLGLVGFLWHLPLLLDPRSPMSQLSWPLQAVFLVAMSVLLTWVYRGTGGSLWWVTVFHAMSNAVALGMLQAKLFVASYPVVVFLVAVAALSVAIRYGRWSFAVSRDSADSEASRR